MPATDKRASNEASTTFKAKLGTNNIVSYEDLLIAQYIDDVKKGPTISSKSGGSPYLGRYVSIEEGLYKTGGRPVSAKHDRSRSAYTESKSHPRPNGYSAKRNRPVSAVLPHQKPKIDAKFIADPDLWDPATPRENSSRGRRARPASAPNRPASAKHTYGGLIDHEYSLLRKPKKKKPLYKRQPYVIRCTAFKNGDRDICTAIAAPSVKQLLEACTNKLQLNGAARRIFLEDGEELFETREIPLHGEIYVSNGEPFRNPFKSLIRHHEQKQQLQWTLSGITLPEDKKKPKRFQLSKRFQELLSTNHRRIMVFLNGQHTECTEVVSDLKSIEEFLAACTNKLNLRSNARIVYNWHGRKVTDFAQIPTLDACLQEPGTPVLGPVWISCGAGFSPTGAVSWLDEVIADIRRRLKEANHQNKQMNLAIAGDHEKVTIVAMLSMTDPELEQSKTILQADIDALQAVRTKLQHIHTKLSPKAQEERDKGNSYTMQHIQELDITDFAVGGLSLKLKVYQNGCYDTPMIVHFHKRQANRGLSDKDGKLLFEKLLDQCASRLPKPAGAGNQFARRLFTITGDEITSVHAIKNDQEVFLSMGEGFKSPYVLCIHANFEQVTALKRSLPEEPARDSLVKYSLGGEGLAVLETISSDWNASIGVPPEHAWETLDENTEQLKKEELLAAEELPHNHHLLVQKTTPKRNLTTDKIEREQVDPVTAPMLYPELAVAEKKKKGSEDFWPSDSHYWVMNKAGYIYSKGMPQLVMSVLDVRVECKVSTKQKTHASGFAVGLQKKQEGNPAQQWRFSVEGTIFSVDHPDYILTYLGNQLYKDESQVTNEVKGTPSGFHPALAVCEKITGKDKRMQRFAMKQERFDNLGQWKQNDHELVTNSEFNKLAYSWPVDQMGELIDKFDWPMEFSLIVMAPSIKSKEKANTGHAPLRLVVMKNGESDHRHCSPVVGPDLTNMIKDIKQETVKSQKKKSRVHSPTKKSCDQEDSVSDFHLHCDDLTFRELEFRLFLERSTSALDLPFAARRLFDEDGTEHHTLQDLKRDQLVYVTCGEMWIDPKLSKAEQQRRFLLTNLASDIAHIRQFCALRDTEGYVLEVEGADLPNARIVLNHCPDMQEKIEQETAVEVAEREKKEAELIIEKELFEANQTAHERSHLKNDEKDDKINWPWERLGNDDLTNLQESPRRTPSPTRARSGSRPRRETNIQRFHYDNGYISCQSDPSLVFGVGVSSEGQLLEVILVKRKANDTSQMWIIKSSGHIFNKAHRDMVMTVSMPTNERRDEGLTLTYVSCPVVLSKKKNAQFGSASQKWNFETKTGLVYAFHTNHLDAEISAANKSNVCTSAVTQDELDQPGYIVSLPNKTNQMKDYVVCSSCARSMRGKHKLNKLPSSHDFSCATGNGKIKELKSIGSLKCLQGKVDLSTFEAINTLDEWETKFNSMQEEMSVRVIAKELSAADQPPTVKIYAYKNGEGRKNEGQLIVGSSIIGLLDQCTYRLGMTNAARRLYARDGEVILDIDDLIRWAVDHYTSNMSNKSEIMMNEEGAQDGAETQSMDSNDLKYQTISLESEASCDNYIPVNSEPIELQHALVEVTGSCDDHIALVYGTGTESTVVYEIIFGREGESSIIIHHPDAAIMEAGDELNVKRFSPLPTSNEVEKYWISWESGCVKVGRNFTVGFDTFMSVQDSKERQVNSLVVATPGKDTKWKFHLPIIGSTVNSNASGPTDLQKLMDRVDLDDDEEDVGSKKEDLSTKEDLAETMEKPRKSRPAPKIEPPPLSAVLSLPIEIWASAGEAFVKPEKVEANQKQMRHYRKLVADISYELHKEKHRLRQMKGRRLMEQNAGHYEATASATKPVVLRHHWQETTFDETLTRDEVHQLENKQNDIRGLTSPRTRPRFNSRLYAQPTMKRVLGYANGELMSRAQFVWGDSSDQLLNNATTRLSLRRPAKIIFSINGQPLEYDELERDQLVCFSMGGQFQRSKDIQQEIEVRANWTRARKQRGFGATDLAVHSQPNPNIDVDPFGPPSLASK